MPLNVNGYEIDSFEAIQHQYEGLVKKSKLKGRGR